MQKLMLTLESTAVSHCSALDVFTAVITHTGIFGPSLTYIGLLPKGH